MASSHVLPAGTYIIRNAADPKLIMTPYRGGGEELAPVITYERVFQWDVVLDGPLHLIQDHSDPVYFARVDAAPFLWVDTPGVFLGNVPERYEISPVSSNTQSHRYRIRNLRNGSVFKSNGFGKQVTLAKETIDDLTEQWDFIQVRIRRDIRELEYQYSIGNREPLETLIRAFKGIAALPPDDFNSFFVIAGYHGMPFRGAGWGNPQWWGGYCNHGNVLFPVWHRAYCLRLEDALRSIDGCSHVTLPYWDQTDDATKSEGLPFIFLQKTFTIDKETFPNPLYSYQFGAGIYDNLDPIPDADYSKPPGYQTVRYPFSGLVGPSDAAATTQHNATLTALGDTVTNKLLNDNIKNWLDISITNDKGVVIHTGARAKYHNCLDAPNYTVFSNGTSATQYNEDHFQAPEFVSSNSVAELVVPLESPHDDIHLAVGGYEVPPYDFDNYPGANGDMGENDTAGFDPIFYFHHCFIDKMFWTWQVRWSKTTELDVIPQYPGTNSVDSQGPTPGVAGNVWLDMNTPLDPFKQPNGEPMTGHYVTDINNLNYEFSNLYVPPLPTQQPAKQPIPTLRITGINRGSIAGSFVVSTWANKKLIHAQSVLSRWHVSGCANCGTHLNVKAFVPLHGWSMDAARNAKLEVLVHTRNNRKGSPNAPNGVVIKPRLGAV